MVRLAFVAACCVLAVGTAAEAQVTNVTGSANTFVTQGGTFTGPLTGVGVANPSDTGAASYASTISIVPSNVNPTTVTFESGNVVLGTGVSSFSSTTVNLALLNNTNSVVMPTLSSQITAAGMGFYMADTSTGCALNPASCAQSQGLSTLRDLVGPAGVGGVLNLGSANFDFSIVSNDHTLYSVHGSMELEMNADGIFVATDVLDAQNKLSGFTQFTPGNTGSALAFGWNATNVPLLALGALDPDTVDQVTYNVSVSSFSSGVCLADHVTCLVAYSAFGDPIGSAGAVTNSALFDGLGLSSFGAAFAPLAGPTFIQGVSFTPVSVDAPMVSFGAVPEPTTWVSMIFGFGLLGAALRRRGVSAYT